MTSQPLTDNKLPDEIQNSHIYKDNIEFWDRAWNMVKQAYTQMPSLDYLPVIAQRLEQQQGKDILDLGCGSGWLSIYLGRQGYRVSGVDIAPHAVELARSWANQEQLPLEFFAQDIASLNFPADKFAAAVANSIFEHLTWDLAVNTINHLQEVISPSGLFIGCFDLVGTGPGEYYQLPDGTHVYTDKGRKGMLLRCYSDEEILSLLNGWHIQELTTIASGSRLVVASNTKTAKTTFSK